MWFKLDDGFATHPKILTAGPYALVIQVRAICYASKNKTDGFLPFSVLPYLLVDVPGTDWPEVMLRHHLWDLHDAGYVVHDFLQWNQSKQQQEEHLKSLKDAGRKGAKRRWGKGKRSIANPIANPIGEAYSQAIGSHSTSSSLSAFEKQPLKTLHSSPLQSLKTPDLKSKHQASKSGETWSAYRLSFQTRYGVDPVRNAKTNSQLGKLVDRLGQDEAPAVAAFYCTHNAHLYVQGKHCVDLLLRDAEGLRMEWATGRQVTNGQAQLTDRTSTTGSIVKKLIAEEEAKHVDRRA